MTIYTVSDAAATTGNGGSEPSSIVKIRGKLAEPSIQQTLRGFSKTVQFSFTDLDENYLLTIEDGKLSKVEKKATSRASIVVTVTNKVMDEIMNKTRNAISAYMTGEIKIKGDMGDLMRLQNLMS